MTRAMSEEEKNYVEYKINWLHDHDFGIVFPPRKDEPFVCRIYKPEWASGEGIGSVYEGTGPTIYDALVNALLSRDKSALYGDSCVC